MFKSVGFYSKAQAEATKGIGNAIIISISGTHGDTVAELQPGWRDVLRLGFDDIDPNNTYVLPLVPFQKVHADAIMAFLSKYENEDLHVVVHCHAGVSRSAAVAKFIAETYRLKFPDSYSVYNKHVYRTLVRARNVRDYGDDLYYKEGCEND